jgi:hypothetical protein
VAVLDWNVGKYSLFFAIKGLLNLLVLIIVGSIYLNAHQKKMLHKLIILLGVFVSLYCIPEYLNPFRSIEIKPGLTVPVPEGIIIGPFSDSTYFTVSIYSTLSAMFTLSYAAYVKGIVRKAGILAIALFIAFPALYSGSRSGIVYILISVCAMTYIYIFHHKGDFALKTFKLLSIVFAAIVVLTLAKVDNFSMRNKTLDRFYEYEEGSNSVENRINIYRDFFNYDYVYSDYMPVIGVGYGVAPINTSSGAKYRIGYGFHNSYFKNLEQGGIVAFTLFFVFLYRIYKELKKRIHSSLLVERSLSMAALSFFFAALVVSWVGVGPWYSGVGIFYLTLVLISVKPTIIKHNH